MPAFAIGRPRLASISGIRRLSLGNPGDVKPVGEGVSELRIDYGPGYRVYLIQQGTEFIVLLASGPVEERSPLESGDVQDFPLAGYP